jgi:hypothetical protein
VTKFRQTPIPLDRPSIAFFVVMRFHLVLLLVNAAITSASIFYLSTVTANPSQLAIAVFAALIIPALCLAKAVADGRNKDDRVTRERGDANDDASVTEWVTCATIEDVVTVDSSSCALRRRRSVRFQVSESPIATSDDVAPPIGYSRHRSMRCVLKRLTSTPKCFQEEGGKTRRRGKLGKRSEDELLRHKSPVVADRICKAIVVIEKMCALDRAERRKSNRESGIRGSRKMSGIYVSNDSANEDQMMEEAIAGIVSRGRKRNSVCGGHRNHVMRTRSSTEKNTITVNAINEETSDDNLD